MPSSEMIGLPKISLGMRHKLVVFFTSVVNLKVLETIFSVRESTTASPLLSRRGLWFDAAVFAAYGWPPDLPDEDILARLLALNQPRRAAKP